MLLHTLDISKNFITTITFTDKTKKEPEYNAFGTVKEGLSVTMVQGNSTNDLHFDVFWQDTAVVSCVGHMESDKTNGLQRAKETSCRSFLQIGNW